MKSSESAVPNLLRSRSASSRMSSTLYVEDISDKEAIEYCSGAEVQNTLKKEGENVIFDTSGFGV